jgi:hypothetical protein
VDNKNEGHMPIDTVVADVLAQIEQKIKVTPDKNPRKEVLSQLLILLMNAHDWDTDSLTRALDYLEFIPFQASNGIFTKSAPKLLGTLLAQESGQLTPAKLFNTHINPSTPILSSSDRDFFLNIHHKIETTRDEKKRWTYQYPLDPEKNEIINPNIANWKEMLSKPSDMPGHAYEDFKRNYHLLTQRPRDNHETKILLNQLVDQTTYHAEEKALLLDWLSMNGGQETNRFLDFLIQNGEFTAKEGYCAGQARSMGANWGVNNGKLTLHFAVQYLYLLSPDNKCLTMDLNGITDHISLDELELLKKSKNLAPLMQANVKLQLEIVDGKVCPKVMDLTLTSYSKQIISPEDALRKKSPSSSR